MRFHKCFNATTLLGVWQFVEMFCNACFKIFGIVGLSVENVM